MKIISTRNLFVFQIPSGSKEKFNKLFYERDIYKLEKVLGTKTVVVSFFFKTVLYTHLNTHPFHYLKSIKHKHLF